MSTQETNVTSTTGFGALIEQMFINPFGFLNLFALMPWATAVAYAHVNKKNIMKRIAVKEGASDEQLQHALSLKGVGYGK